MLKKPPLLRLLSREAKLHGTSDLAKLNELATQGEVTEAEAVFRQLEHVSYSWKPSSRTGAGTNIPLTSLETRPPVAGECCGILC